MMKFLDDIARFIRGVFTVRSGSQSIVRSGGEMFLLSDPSIGKRSIRLSEVVSVSGTKVDKVTYEEDFMILTQSDGSQIVIGELADGFSEFEEAICASCAGFPKHWRALVEVCSVGSLLTLWNR